MLSVCVSSFTWFGISLITTLSDSSTLCEIVRPTPSRAMVSSPSAEEKIYIEVRSILYSDVREMAHKGIYSEAFTTDKKVLWPVRIQNRLSDATDGSQAIHTLTVDVENQLHFVAFLVQLVLRGEVLGTVHYSVLKDDSKMSPAVETVMKETNGTLPLADVDVVVLAGVFTALIDKMEVTTIKKTIKRLHFRVLQNFKENGVTNNRIIIGW